MKRNKMPLALLAILLGVGGALATRAASRDSLKVFAYDQSSKTWVDVTGQTEGVDFQCNASRNICTAEFTNNDPIHGTMVESTNGDYQPL